MLALVLVRVAVPPAPAGPAALGVRGVTAGRLRLVLLVHGARRRSVRSACRCRDCEAVRPRGTSRVPVMGRSAPGVRVRALTGSGCPRMLQVALRACAPQTEQAALASVCMSPRF
ncbi:hypothetical protein FS847_27610 [Streptomyces sp. ISID311]|nr:hypothetical protein FS847_27610 [Streptomyces sp. ISID311]